MAHPAILILHPYALVSYMRCRVRTSVTQFGAYPYPSSGHCKSKQVKKTILLANIAARDGQKTSGSSASRFVHNVITQWSCQISDSAAQRIGDVVYGLRNMMAWLWGVAYDRTAICGHVAREAKDLPTGQCC